MSDTQKAIVAYYFCGPENLVLWKAKEKSWFSVMAVSGGGRGQKLDGHRLPYGKDNARLLQSVSHRIKKDETKGVRGGPIPPGLYRIHKPSNHPNLKRSAFLEPAPSNRMYGRGEFFIHGSGGKGSDGCIIPGTSSVFPVLDLLDELYSAYAGRIYLKVVSGERALPASGTADHASSVA